MLKQTNVTVEELVSFHYDQLKDFVRVVEQFESDIDAIKGRYTIDCKSIMGLLSINFEEGFRVRINSQSEEEIERFHKEMSKWRVND